MNKDLVYQLLFIFVLFCVVGTIDYNAQVTDSNISRMGE